MIPRNGRAAKKGRRIRNFSLRSFKNQVNSMGKAPDGFSFPDGVVYPSACDDVCLESCTLDVRQCYLAVLSGLAAFAKQWKPTDVSSEDILLMLQSFANDGSSPAVVFCFLSLCQGRHVGQPSQQTFVELQPRGIIADYSDLRGVVLEIIFETFAVPLRKCRTPLNQQEFGPMKNLSEDDMAVRFVECCTSSTSVRTDKCNLDRVVVRRLRYDDISLCRVKGERFHDAVPFTIEIRPQPKMKKTKAGSSGSAPKVDLCSDVIRPSSPRRSSAAPLAPLSATPEVEHAREHDELDEGTVKQFMKDLGVHAEAAQVTSDDFCKSDGIMSALCFRHA